MSKPHTSFDTLPEEVLARVVKKLKRREERPLQLFVPSSPFRRASPSVFNRLNVVIHGQLSCNTATGELYVGEFADMDVLTVHALEACGEGAFRTVSITIAKGEKHPYLVRPTTGRLGAFLAKFCKSEAKIVLDDFPEFTALWAWKLMLEVTRSVGTRAGHVEFNVSRSAVQPRATWPGFTDYISCISTFPQLKSLSYNGDYCMALEIAWCRVGRTLQHVEITLTCDNDSVSVFDGWQWDTCIRALKKHCRQLSSIHLCCPLRDEPQLAEGTFVRFLTSYGDQLVSARLHLHHLSLRSCTHIAKKCNNLRSVVVCGIESVDRLAVLHDRVDTVFFDLVPNENWPPLSVVMPNMSFVSKLTVNPVTQFPSDAYVPEEFIKHMFSPKLMLVNSLTILSYMDPHCLSYIASSASQLKQIQLHFESLDHVDLGPLVRANPHLKRAHIEEYMPIYHGRRVAKRIATGLITALATAQEMTWIKIEFFLRVPENIFHELLSSLRTRTNLSVDITFTVNKPWLPSQ